MSNFFSYHFLYPSLYFFREFLPATITPFPRHLATWPEDRAPGGEGDGPRVGAADRWPDGLWADAQTEEGPGSGPWGEMAGGWWLDLLLRAQKKWLG